VYDRLRWASDLVSQQHLDEGTYKEFMRLLYAAMYVCAAQGRVAGVASLTLQQGRELLDKGHVFSTKFKTAAAWTYQPVMITDTTRDLLTIYLDHVRPQRSRLATSGPEAPLWLDFNGEADMKVGVKVVRFFRGAIDLHMTTNAIRSLVETTMNEAHLKGDITYEEQQSVHAINGHSGKTTEDYYILCDRTNEVTSARNAFDRISFPASHSPDGEVYAAGAGTPESTPSTDTPMSTPLGSTPHTRLLPTPSTTPQRATAPYSWPRRDVLVAADWGREHPDYGEPGKRASWTDAEVTYVGNYCEAKLRNNPSCPTPVAECLKHMHTDPAARAIFHKIHVLDSGRLRNGYRLYLARKANGEWP
jgi:hypothetical protein